MSYRKGQQITCPHCGKDSVVKVISELDGWAKVGECYACALCKTKLADCNQAHTAPKDQSKAAGSSKLADFLGTRQEAVKEVVDDDGQRRFCRDCGHLMEHPFKVYCLFHKKEVSPMDDCEHFKAETDDDEVQDAE